MLRLSFEDLRCDANVVSLDSRSGSTREIRNEIEGLVTTSHIVKIEVLNVLSQKIAFTHTSS